MGLIGVIGFIGTPGIAGLLVAGMCEDKVTGSAVRHYTQGAFSPIRPIIPMFAFSRPILTDYTFPHFSRQIKSISVEMRLKGAIVTHNN